MPRKHIHVPGTARRRDYNIDKMEDALRDVIENGVSFGQAAERHGVPKATLYKKYRGEHGDKLGRPTALSFLEERTIKNALETAAGFRMPFSERRLQDFVEQYLNRKGVKNPSFKDNRPGKDWCASFLKRHERLSKRNCENIKRCRAEVGPEIISEYFRHLKNTLEGVPPSNILNYDETNLTDDPGKEKVFVCRGTKHASRIMDTSKSSTSLMFCVTGDGNLLPLYIVYKAKYLYPDWVEGGPDGTRYNRTESGWFDSDTFEDWFMKIALPYLKRKEGKKVILGDNLGTHLTFNVLRECENNSTDFVLFPTNSTHICQPLDVAFFRPVKISWRKILTKWKSKNRGVVPKQQFPKLLKELWIDINENAKANILAGFKATGISPLNEEKVLEKIRPPISSNQPTAETAMKDSFVHILKDLTNVAEKSTIKRKRKIKVPAGMSISTADLEVATSSTIKTNETKDDAHELDEGEYEETNENEEIETQLNFKTEVTGPYDIEEGCFVVVSFTYNENTKKQCVKEYVAQIIQLKKKTIEVSCLRMYKERKDSFVFPSVLDKAQVTLKAIKFLLSQPVIRRGVYRFPGNVF